MVDFRCFSDKRVPVSGSAESHESRISNGLLKFKFYGGIETDHGRPWVSSPKGTISGLD